MEQKDIKKTDDRSTLKIENRKKIFLDGVLDVISFNEEQIILNTNLGTLHIKGEELKMSKLDVQNGDVVINGTINSCIYLNKENKRNKEKLLSKLFK
ncbi:sporulation protein YabP [Clostridium cochlearium]|uniref:sporulation protein YabP n=1 Tax=Clostridium cochlearium TaxID=1494 RepID=UPI0014597E41|nr:sporulation protein YabP [Clostridium cochlearium]MBV1816699.1 sporulation protein YabP [Bacteroidales bacterium MSK.15.36]NSJ90534.1 sporulation protein YabP [Coprococcus sp. MSK.21.13]MCG4571253.1 sporulation protein YabP [Clostridium cochlearium]MCR1972013.1 sporulation protein YabP [Clostridium cochlearium]NME95089.1 sporulation protein YabP [Clostridium cochlearium]